MEFQSMSRKDVCKSGNIHVPGDFALVSEHGLELYTLQCI